MYKYSSNNGKFDVIGIDGDVITSLGSQADAAKMCKELEKEYLTAIGEAFFGFDVAAAVKEARPDNIISMGVDEHEICQIVNEISQDRNRRWNRLLRCFTEIWKPRSSRKEMSQEDYRAALDWTPSQEVYRPKGDNHWARKLKSAL